MKFNLSPLLLSFAINATLIPLDAHAQQQQRFDQDVRPILSNHCWSCHGPDEVARQAGLRLDRQDSATAAGESGRFAIVPGKPAESELIARINSHDPALQMPPASAKKPVTDAQKLVLQRWIKEGAEFTSHWAYQAPVRAAVPTVQNASWPKNTIDAFVLQHLEKEKLLPSEEAAPHVWLRRVTFDLTGLPPSLMDLSDFEDCLETTEKEGVYAEVVERLLKSSRYGERMAMQWLDAARYADTNGYNNDETRTMWPWRDWVIKAYTDGMPYDQFLTEQLAGDLLPEASVSQKVATGFNRNHVLTTEGGIFEEEYHVEYVADRVHTTATVFLAMSLQCARCHDHKYDPLTQKEYYQFAAFFNNVPDKVVSYNKARMAEPLLQLPTPTQQVAWNRIEGRLAAVEAELAKLAGEAGADPTSLQAEKTSLTEQRTTLQSEIPATMVMVEPAEPRAIFVLKRGQYDQRGEQVTAAFPHALVSLESAVSATGPEPLNRLQLARWLTDPAHPLTARVAVNRQWEMLFGIGLVETAEDFGIQGALPSHPELLDWLATELVRQGWDQRAILQQIVLSATYRQSSNVNAEQLHRDPRNLLLGRGPRYRLPAETVRDNALFVSGLLQEKLGGPSVKPYQPAGLWEDVSVERRDKYVADTDDGLYRRSMYTFWKRTCPPPSMATFDAPDRETCTVRRARTNTPLQALILLNDPTYVEAARKVAERVLLASDSDEARIGLAFRIVLSRLPSDSEQEILQEILDDARIHFTSHSTASAEFLSIGNAPHDTTLNPLDLAAWSAVMSVVMNLDECISKL
ncbi:MAG: PSD1 and planctomycete cytochrome C domain-containing protein [Planctomycetales bacterium]|nr:PSD1 and planctomycete cytochrome C domain-containing protein [Planctomycetales bacterium]